MTISDGPSITEEPQENTKHISESKANRKKDSQLTKKLPKQKNENANNETFKMLQSFADKLIDSDLAEWHKITLENSQKGLALFFPFTKWNLANNELTENKS